MEARHCVLVGGAGNAHRPQPSDPPRDQPHGEPRAPPGTVAGRRERREGTARAIRDIQRVPEQEHCGPGPHRPVQSWQRPGCCGRRDHPARPTRRAADQRVRLRRDDALAEAFQDNYLSMLARTAPTRSTTRTCSSPRRTRGSRPGFDLNNNGVVGGRRRRRSASASSRASSGWPSSRSTRSTARPGPDLPALPVEGHAGRAAPRRPGHAGAGRLVLARGAGDLPAVVQEPLGPADRDRRRDRPLPRQPPDAAGLRRPRGPQRHAQLRRDPVLGRLHHARPTADYIYDDEGEYGRPRARRDVRDRRRPELRPARRRQHPGAIQQLLEHAARQRQA